ncbi:uncharacterized protein L3040_000170 [Drepanopeziza brunnea f. sp. 'multigermtubi']|uniref:uncharacterized protein n=1 Tax=Drepanopeziza brunnea f. sp. 'multigermtubi' TaxID=698441 RepID=UPI00239DAEAC|nr:hypothetical protein L3040_000170 [Drepanopeziza brunnea f. sp. 'multigermtubi']
MPPSGSPTQSSTGQIHPRTADPYYSNEDVALLHDIVVLAQELLPGLPERERLPTNALFNAYYDILPRIGVNADHDSRYARVLFKIGGLRGAGTLYEKFEEILARMGIEIEFDHGDDDNDNTEGEYNQAEQSQHGLDVSNNTSSDAPAAGNSPKRRRNSESSAWDLGIDQRTPITPRRNSFTTIGNARSEFGTSQGILQELRQPASRSNIRAPSKNRAPVNHKEEDTVDNVGLWLNARSPKLRGRSRGRSVSTHASLRIRRRGRSNSTGRGHYSHFGEETRELLHDEQPAHQPENLLEIKASLVLQQSARHLTRQIFRQWRHKTLQLQEDVKILNRVANWHDKRSLLRSAFDQWRAQYLEKHTSTDEEQFYAHLEEEATKARNTTLLQRAFNHWSNSANEQVERTAVARRHIVRTRVFNAWKEITAVNEMKVRRHVLKKFFSKWVQKREETARDNTAAVQMYEDNLVKKVYDQWARKVSEHRATALWAEGAKRRALFKWIVVSHNNWERSRTAEESARLDLMWNKLKVWKNQIEVRRRQEQQAEEHYRHTLLTGSFVIWRREQQLLQPKFTVMSNVATRRLQDSFRIWAHRARLEKQAAEVDRTRILREALTAWRLKHRTQIVVARQNRRIAAEALYKWNVQEKLKLAQQLLARRRLQSTLQAWKEKSKASSEQAVDLEAMAQAFVARKRQNAVLQCWNARMASKQQLEAAAVEFRNPRLTQGVVSKWSAQLEHVQELEQRSRIAEYYFATTKALKKWKASTEAAKREKRKLAYIQVRRTAKINLARNVLEKWREKARQVSSLQAQAAEVRHNKDIIIGMDIFDRWKGNAEALAGLESLWRETVLKKHFTAWRRRTDAVLALETEAVLTYQESQTSRAVKRWSLQTLQRGAHSNYAAEIREKNAKKNFRKIFTYWRHTALERRPLPRRKVGFAEPAQLGATERAEAWSDFGDENEMNEWVNGLDEGGGAASTPIPGYLSTPSRSRRSQRVMAVAAKYSTTPRAPLSTPFEKKLRAQWSGG